MQTPSFIRSLMEFNKRVLYQGTMYVNKSYKMKDLKDKLFFNEIFISNMQEMFQKYDVIDVMDDYIECIGIYCRNMTEIIGQITSIKSGVKISRENCFERRLAAEKVLPDQIITKSWGEFDSFDYQFMDNIIYYISRLPDEGLTISFVDSRRSAYSDVMKHNFQDGITYWKSDDCIRDYIKERYLATDTIAIRVTTSIDTSEVTKVEYNGDTNFMESLIGLFPESALIISNPYIYTGDIKYVIESQLDEVLPVSKPRFEPMNLQQLFEKDILIEYPNDSFDEYLHFLSLASKHPNVRSIYLTLYRIGDNPAIFYILRDAVKNGINVCVNIELFASGETINRMWLREMMNAGMHVTTYAAGQLKVHCKLTLVQFSDHTAVVQIGTGNYHTKTTTQYTDFSLITADRNICQQVFHVFRLLNGDEDVSFDKDLLVTRSNARKELIKLIDAEAHKGRDGCIVIKCNALDDDEIARHLEKAAENECMIDLIIRGVCTWIPRRLGINVFVKSIVWDKLEHSRVFCFGMTNPTIYLGSLDLVTKKLDQRIETLVKIKSTDIGIKICDYLNRYITSSEGSWLLTSSGLYIKE